MKLVTPLILVLGLAPLAACGTHTLIGIESDAGLPPSDDASFPADSPTSLPEANIISGDGGPSAIPAALRGTWKGYFEGYTLVSGSDTITLTLATGSDGVDRINLVLGDAPPPAPPTDPTAAWPAGHEVVGGYAEGFSYPAHDVRWQGVRLTFKVDSAEAYDAWCRLQTSYPDNNSSSPVSYTCLPLPFTPGLGTITPGPDGGLMCFENVTGGGPDAGIEAPVSCAQLSGCDGDICVCDASSCSAMPTDDFSYDITFEPNLASGVGSPGNTLKLMPVPM